MAAYVPIPSGKLVKYEYLTTDDALRDFCTRLEGAPLIAFDTEFVSEDRYVPELCLVQVAAAGEAAIVDPLVIPDLRPLWRLLSAPGHVSVVHAGPFQELP